jgi:hypothetical protein
VPFEKRWEGIMEMRSIFTSAAVGFITICTATTTWADETIKFREVLYANSVQSQDVGDVEGHVVSIGRFSGLISFPDNTVGTSYFTATTDYIKGAGSFVVYINYTFSDGSVLWAKQSGTTTVEGTKSVFQGSGTITGGKGKYEGAKGDLTLSGARLAPLATGAFLYLDLVINLKNKFSLAF